MDILRFKKFSPAIFWAILICFALPFINISCNNQIVKSFSGVKLVTGTTIYEPDMFGGVTPHRINPEFLAILAAICAVVGVVFFFLKHRKAGLIRTIISWLGTALLLLLLNKVKNDVLRASGGMIGVSGGIGFWLSVFLFSGSGCFHFFIHRTLVEQKKEE